MTIFNSVDFWGIQKTARKSVTDFGSVFTKRREGCIFCAAIFRVCHPAQEMALPSFWAKSLFPLLQRHCHWRKWHIKEEVFFEDSDGGIHILHNRHIASIEPVCTSTDVPSRFFLVVQKIPLLWLQLKCFNLWSVHNRGYTGAPSVITTLVLPPFVFEEMSEKALHSNKRLRLSGGGFPFLCALLLPRLYKYICPRSCGFTGLRKNPKTWK